MKRIGLGAILLILITALSVSATPYNTITIDGEWGAGEWDQANEIYASNTYPGWDEFGNVRSALVTWDASNLYIGVRGNSWNNAMLIYIDSSSILTGQENADFFQGFDTQSFFDPDFVGGHYNMEWGSGAIPTDIRTISAVDGTTASLLGTADIAVHDQNHDGGLNEGFTEIAIPWSLIGLEPGGSVSIAVSAGWANEQNPVIPAGGLGGFTGDELAGTDQQGGTDGLDGTLDTPFIVHYDLDSDGLPDQLTDIIAPSIVSVTVVEGTQDNLTVEFDEPVTSASVSNLANWVIDGELLVSYVSHDAPPITSATLFLDADVTYGFPYTVTADNIEDMNGNISGPISASFCLAQLTFTAHMKYKIEAAGELLDVGIEGSVAPLTWDPTCDDLLYDDGTHGDVTAADSIYTAAIDFCLSYDHGEESPVVPLLYKLTYGCTEWESIENHYYNDPGISCGTGQVEIDIWWNDENPEAFTVTPMDVIFTVDVSDSLLPAVIGLNGGTGAGGAIPPLNWNLPSETILSDGDYPGGVTDDGIYGTVVRFPAGSFRHVEGKYLYNDQYECLDQDNRHLYLNDAAYDTIGGAMGPLTLLLERLNRCSVTKRAVELVLSVDLNYWYQTPGGGDIIAVNGNPNNQEPTVINWDIPSINPMADDGVAPDAVAGDLIYTRSIVFPDSSSFHVEYKYLFNEEYECTTQTNRWFWINSYEFDATGYPQVLALDMFNSCEPVSVEEGIVVSPIRMGANYPNPFNPQTTLRFTIDEPVKVQLRIYDMAGRLVRTLIDGDAPAGEHTTVWFGRDDTGRQLSSGVYFARLQAANRVVTQKMTLLK